MLYPILKTLRDIYHIQSVKTMATDSLILTFHVNPLRQTNVEKFIT